MQMILAQKGKLKRTFTKEAWDRLGKDHSGYTALPPEAQEKAEGKKVIVPHKQTAETPAAKTVAQLQEELAAAIAAEEAEEATKNTGTEEVGERPGPEYTGPYSTDEGTTWQAAMKHIKSLQTAAEVNNYVAQDDTRKTVLGARDLRLEEIKQSTK